MAIPLKEISTLVKNIMENRDLIMEDHEGNWFFLSPRAKIEALMKNRYQNVRNSPILNNFLEWVDNSSRRKSIALTNATPPMQLLPYGEGP